MSATNRKPKNVKQKSNRRHQELLERDDERNNPQERKSPSLNKSIDNIFMEKSLDTSMFTTRSSTNLNARSSSNFSQRTSGFKQTDLNNTNSIYEIYKSINEANLNGMNNESAEQRQAQANAILVKDIFNLEGRSVDLEMYDDIIKWRTISSGRLWRF